MKQTRKEFLKNIAVISAANLILPSWLRARPYGSIQVYFPELEGTTFTGSLVQVIDSGTGVELGRGTTTDSQATILFTSTGIKENKDNTQLLSKMDAQDLGGTVVISYPVHNESKVEIGLYDILGRRLWEKNSYQIKGNHSYDFKIAELASGRYILRVKTNDYSGSMLLPIIDHTLAKPQNTPPTQSIVNMKSSKKIDRLDKINSGDYKIIVSNSNAHYTRTVYTSPVDKFKDRVTGYVQQNGVTWELFKNFAWQVNFSSIVGVHNVLGCGYEGMKTYLQKKNKQIWITYEDAEHHYIQSAENQTYIKNLLTQKILIPAVNKGNYPTIYLADPAHPENRPLTWDGVIDVEPFPKVWYNWSYISQDINTGKSSEGFIDSATLFFGGGDNFGNGSTWADTAYDQKKITLFMRALCAPADTADATFNNLTVLSSSAPAAELTAMDKKLIKIAEYYKPKSPIDEILGI